MLDSVHREGLLIGIVAGASLGTPPGAASGARRPAAVALGDALLAEFLDGGVDLHRLARRWLDWEGEAGMSLPAPVSEALAHLREFDAPAPHLAVPNVTALAAALPAAIAGASPRAMVSGTFHVARLLDPGESTALCAVALTVAASIFLEGRRDFIADVISLLRANAAGEEMLERVRSIARDRRAVPELPRGGSPDPVATTVWALWQAHHRVRGVDAMHEVAAAGDADPAVGAVAGGLLGARDGLADWPREWLESVESQLEMRRRVLERIGDGA